MNEADEMALLKRNLVPPISSILLKVCILLSFFSCHLNHLTDR